MDEARPAGAYRGQKLAASLQARAAEGARVAFLAELLRHLPDHLLEEVIQRRPRDPRSRCRAHVTYSDTLRFTANAAKSLLARQHG
jgi:hypothetical protein